MIFQKAFAWCAAKFSSTQGGRKRRIILHLGFHKTATSSIQQSCANARSELLKQGVNYPIFEFKGVKYSNHSMPIFSAFTDAPEKYFMNIKSGLKGETDSFNTATLNHLSRLVKSKEDLLISGEGIGSLGLKQLIRLRDYLTSAEGELVVICAVRRPYSMVCSSYQEVVKGGRRSTFDDGIVPRKSKDAVKLESVFGNSLRFLSFDRLCTHSDGPVAAFFEELEIAFPRRKIVNSNEGLSNLSVRAVAAVNATYPPVKDGKLNPNGRDQKVDNIHGSKFLLTQAEYKVVESILIEENKFFKNQFGDEFCDKVICFSDALKMDLPTAVDVVSTYAKPARVADSLLDFCVDHSDGTWHLKCLIKSLQELEQFKGLQIPEQGKLEAGDSHE